MKLKEVEFAKFFCRYKFETKTLEDHVRITTRISEKNDDVFCLLYISNNEANDCIKELENVKKLQESNMEKK